MGAKRVRTNSLPWITDQIRTLIKQKNYHHKKAQKAGSSNEWTKYRELRNRVTKLIRDSRRNYYSNMIEENSSDSNKVWQALKTTISSNTKSTQTGSLEVDGESISEPKNISTSFRTFFKVVRNSFPFSITTELYERFTRL